jgi:hypothetical protein
MFSWPWHQLEVGGQLHAPAALLLGKKQLPPPIPIGEEAGWTPEPVWTISNSYNPWPHRDSNSDLSAIQPIASRYTGYATTAHKLEGGVGG